MHRIYSTTTQNGQIAKEEIYLSKPLSKVSYLPKMRRIVKWPKWVNCKEVLILSEKFSFALHNLRKAFVQS